MTDTQINLVQTTFGQVKDADLLASRFYGRLFEVNPELQTMFKGDMAEQRKKLLQVLAVVVHSLNNLESIIPAVEALGRRHVGYGVTVEHWEMVGSALLWALEDAFGDAFTSEVRDAWATAYGLIAQTAMSAAYPVSI
jgi:hemoglobin-like flavoprotein